MKQARSDKQIKKDPDAERSEILHDTATTRYLDYARTRVKNKHLTLRLNEGDLAGLKAIAVQKGKKYQTLIGEILHKYVRKNIEA